MQGILHEHFYCQLIGYFDSIDDYEYKGYVQLVESVYFENKKRDAKKALKHALPLPDRNPHQRELHLLPNFNAFMGLLGRVQKHKSYHRISQIDILHDEQKQFHNIYTEALDSLRNNCNDSYIKDVVISATTSLNIDNSISLKFDDSKSLQSIQIADLIAGFVMRFWLDFVNEVGPKLDIYLPSFIKLSFYDLAPSAGINFVVPDAQHRKFTICASFMERLNFKPNI